MGRIVTSASSIRPLAILCILSIPVPALCRSTAREEAELLARAGEARFRLALLRRTRVADAGGSELAEAIRSLEEARELDPANLRALAFLGLARLEAGRFGRGKTPALDRTAFDSAREPLEDLFELSRGCVDSNTRELVRCVVACMDDVFDRPAAGASETVAWWREWRKVVVKSAEPSETSADTLGLVEKLRGSPFAWERERAVNELASRREIDAAAGAALAETLREDDSPWVRATAARVIGRPAAAGLRRAEAATAAQAGELRLSGWDLLLAEALKNDSSAWVRRSAASALSSSAARPAALGALRAALASDTPRVAAAAARSLGALGGEKELVSALDAPSPLVREAAALALHRPGSEEIKAKLRPLLEDPDDRVRFAGVYALLPTGDSAVLDELRSFRESAVPLENDHCLGFDTIGEAARQLLEALEKTRRQQ